jgi:hypothetical protein
VIAEVLVRWAHQELEITASGVVVLIFILFMLVVAARARGGGE